MFSGAWAAPPRCAKAIGRGCSRNGTTTIASMPVPGTDLVNYGCPAAVQFLRLTSAIATAAATATFSDPTRPGCGM